MQLIKKTKIFLLLLLFAVSFTLSVIGENADPGQNGQLYSPVSSFRSYTYNYWGDPVECPDPYTLKGAYSGIDLGVGNFKNLHDIFIGQDGFIYIAASGDREDDNRIVVFDSSLTFIKEYKGITDTDGQFIPFKKPLGVFVTASGEIYAADGQAKNIYHFKQDGALIRTIEPPKGEIIDDKFIGRYQPSKLCVDNNGRIHVIAININEGIIEFDKDGQFEGFLAAGKVNPNPLQVIWRRFSTAEQLARMSDFVPIEYNNITLDSENFVMATCAAADEKVVISEIKRKKGTDQGALVRRLNMLGKDILRRKGFFPPVGDVDVTDLQIDLTAGYKGISKIMDVYTSDFGVYTVLDNNRNKLFTYDGEGNLLYCFGGPDVSAGGLKTPISLSGYGDTLYVLDTGTLTINVYTQTQFSKRILSAIEKSETGKNDSASEDWQKVLEQNANYDLAYTGMGKASYMKGEYSEAMRLFKLGDNREWYSRAYKEHRKIIVAKWFAPVSLTVLVVISSVWLFAVFRKQKKKKYKNLS